MIQKLYELSRKSEKLALGLMSGTSLDGIDIALVSIKNSGTKTSVKELGFQTFSFPKKLKAMIHSNAETNGGNVTDICMLNFMIARVYADKVNLFLKKLNIVPKDIDFIGSHGQTIHHLPLKKTLFGINTSSTLQIGDPSVLAKLTGILTIGDFRVADVAFDGQGAPLVPYFDYLLYRSDKKNRALLNIGGISNITALPKAANPSDIIAFDCGPGNMLIDATANKYFNKSFDINGKFASKGSINFELINDFLKKDIFVKKTPPKSSGREYYGKYFLQNFEKQISRLNKFDLIATMTYYTAVAIFNNYKSFISNKFLIDELFVSGGGAFNNTLMNNLQSLFGKNISIKTTDAIGISVESKEAVCFAVLANETLCGNPSNVISVTGAKKETILGKICLP